MRFPEIIDCVGGVAGNSNGAMATSASDYQQSDTAERSGFIVDAVSDDVGKGIFATKEFAAGETLFRERPLVSAQEILIPIELNPEGLIQGGAIRDLKVKPHPIHGLSLHLLHGTHGLATLSVQHAHGLTHWRSAVPLPGWEMEY